MNTTVTIDQQIIGTGHEPFVIAEMSGNHNQSLERALEIVDAAAECGAHALKLQTYTADTMTLNLREGDYVVDDPNGLWTGKTMYELYQEAHTPWEWHAPIFERCRKRGVIPFSSPFDSTAVDFLKDLDTPVYKIASPENTDLPLIRKIAETGKPIIMSTGMATVAELDDAVRAAREAGCQNLILLKCSTSYPANPKDVNLATIPHLRDLFQLPVGLSDHTLGIGVAVASVALGANVIEKHFTLSRKDGGPDAAFSMEPSELKQLVIETKRAWEAVGKIQYGPAGLEKQSLKGRRTLHIVEDMKAGDILTPNNLRMIRGGGGVGLSGKYYEVLLGKKVNQNVRKGAAATWTLIG